MVLDVEDNGDDTFFFTASLSTGVTGNDLRLEWPDHRKLIHAATLILDIACGGDILSAESVSLVRHAPPPQPLPRLDPVKGLRRPPLDICLV